MVKTKSKIDPKSFKGLRMRKEFLEELGWWKILFSKEVPILPKITIMGDESPSQQERDRGNMTTMTFLKGYFKDLCKFTNEEMGASEWGVRKGSQLMVSPEGEHIDVLEEYIDFFISEINIEKLKNEIRSYFSDITELTTPYSLEKQEEIIGGLLLRKHKEYGNERIVILPKDFEWGQFIHINLFGKDNVLDSLEKKGLIKDIDWGSFPRLPHPLTFRQVLTSKKDWEADKIITNFFFEIGLTLTDEFYRVFKGKPIPREMITKDGYYFKCPECLKSILVGADFINDLKEGKEKSRECPGCEKKILFTKDGDDTVIQFRVSSKKMIENIEKEKKKIKINADKRPFSRFGA